MDFTPLTFSLKDGRSAVLSAPSAEDAEEMLACLADVSRETDFLLATPAEWQTMTPAMEAVFLQTRRDDPNTLMLLCRVEGRLAGNCHVAFCTHAKTAHRGVIGIALRRAYWNQGIGTAMFQALIAEASRRPGVLQLELDMIEGNTRGQALYEKMGFRTVSVHPDAIRQPDGTLRHEYLMVRKL